MTMITKKSIRIVQYLSSISAVILGVLIFIFPNGLSILKYIFASIAVILSILSLIIEINDRG
jgi:hypothetical protein